MGYRKLESRKTTIFEVDAPEIKTYRKAPYLIAFTGKEGWKRFKVKKEKMTIGRSPKADIVLNDERISGIHCMIQYIDDHVVIEDLNSTNGTYINGEGIIKETATTRSNIQIGRTVMKVDYKDELEIQIENELIRKATTDSITGIANRDNFMSRAQEEIAFAKRTDMQLGLVMLDIDLFKNINDTFGHQAGDYVINRLSVLIDGAKREEDLFGRYGGDEFIVLLRGELDLEGAKVFCDRVRKAIEKHKFQFDGRQIPVTVSLGLCLESGNKIKSLDDLIHRTDQALYRAKQDGRNRVECN